MYTSPSVVFGFHGCDQSVADKVLKSHKALAKSEQSFDWLGHGIYFWEGSAARALEWARQKKGVKNPAVVGAVINLGNCLDLLDDQHIRKVATTHEILESEFRAIGATLPVNAAIDKNGTSLKRELDCKVVMRLHQLNNDAIKKELRIRKDSAKNNSLIQSHPNFIDSVRGMFAEGEELYPTAGFRSRNHIQLCIVNPNCILGYFAPITPDNNFKKF